MRAGRILRMLLLLQERGRLASTVLARELEVTPRTVLRDVDALSEAGIPLVTHRGPNGGIELAFAHRTRLTGLAADEVEALAVLLQPRPEVIALGLGEAAARAVTKLRSALPDQIRAQLDVAADRFRVVAPQHGADAALMIVAQTIREGGIATVATPAGPEAIRPVALEITTDGGWVLDGASGRRSPVAEVRSVHRSGTATTA